MKLPKEILKKGKDILNSTEFKKKLSDELGNEKLVPTDNDKYYYELFIDDDIRFDKKIVEEFIDFCLSYLKVKNYDKLFVVLSTDKEKFTTYAFYDIETKIAAVYCYERAMLDCFRSLAHELVHFKQDINNEIPKEQVSDNNDGVEIENEANSIAGVIMRKFGRLHKDLY